MIMQWNGASTSEAEGLRSAGTEALCEWLDHSEDRVSFDVDKAWHAVHFTLTGDTDSTAGLLGQVVLGGVEFGDEVGYGPARWLPASAVSDVASALAKLTPEEFERRVDFAALHRNDIYPSIWDRSRGRRTHGVRLRWLRADPRRLHRRRERRSRIHHPSRLIELRTQAVDVVPDAI